MFYYLAIGLSFGNASNRLFLFVSSSVSKNVDQAVNKARELDIISNNNCFIDFYTDEDIKQSKPDPSLFKNQDVLLIDTMHPEFVDFAKLVASNCSPKIYSLRMLKRDVQNIIYDKEVLTYFSTPFQNNFYNLLLYIFKKDFGLPLNPIKPYELSDEGYFHPDTSMVFTNYSDYVNWYKASGKFITNADWIGVADFLTYMDPNSHDPVSAYLIKELEKNAFNVLPVFSRSSRGVENIFFDENGKSRVQLICALCFKFSSMPTNPTWKVFERLNIPVVNIFRRFTGTTEDWRNSPEGLGIMEIGWQISMPELDGVIEHNIVGAKNAINSSASKTVYISDPIKDNIKILAQRVLKWIALRKKPNSQKKIAIIFYNHSQGKQNIGASYLNVFRSIENILQHMKQSNYYVEGELLSEEEIKNMILNSARNIGSWAQGELEEMFKKNKAAKFPVEKYKSYFSTLNSSFQEAVLKQWGTPEDSKIMYLDGYFIIPSVQIGNILLAPQPSRGWSDDPMKLYHDALLMPHHQYIAFYLWLQNEFKADCIIHLGTHGTQEWLPGKNVALSQACSPDAILQTMPVVYPYIMDNIGEGLQAKHRGKAVVISHLTPVFGKCGSSSEVTKISELLSEYDQLKNTSPELAAEKLKSIEQTLAKSGITNDLGFSTLSPTNMGLVEDYIEKIRDANVPYGLHTFGISPSNEALADFKDIILSRHKSIDTKEITKKITISGEREIQNFLRALAGGFVVPGQGNDPIRNPAALPSGHNFYGLDPAKIPTREAYKIGAKIAEDMIAKYKAEHSNSYPEKIALIIWSVEVQRNEGTQIGTALNLLGMMPDWDENDRIKGVVPIPGSILKRPRIDILIQSSGLFRDTFPNLIHLIDEAVRQAATMNDIENFIKQNSEKIKAKLIENGLSQEEAVKHSMIRVFSAPPGSYVTRVQELVPNSGVWKNSDEIADVFIRHSSYGYGKDVWGAPMQAAFTNNLSFVQITMHTRSSNLYKTLDNDDVFGFLGAMALAVRRVTGENPDVLIARQENPTNCYIEDIRRTVGEEMRTRVLNPKWIEALKKENYAGAHTISEHIENLWGWQVTTPFVVEAAKWNEVFEIYVQDRYNLGIKEFFNKENPWAYQSITARMLEAIRKNYWNAPEEIQKALAIEYAVSVIEKGVVCCDHTCNNPALNQMVATLISLPGMLSPEMAKKFKETIEKAIGKTLEQAATERADLQKQLASLSENLRDPSKQEVAQLPAKKPLEGFEVKREETPSKKEDDASLAPSSGFAFAVFFIALIVTTSIIGGWYLFSKKQ